MSDLLVSEVFGPTFQGEGPSIGKPCFFLRLGGCSIQCTWCDTRYSWDPKSPHYDPGVMRIENVANKLLEMYSEHRVSRLVISGGEPMQQAKSLDDLLYILHVFDAIEMETSGHVPLVPFSKDVDFNVSPKLAHAQVKVTYNYDILKQYVQAKGRFKFVVNSTSDFVEIDQIVQNVHISPDQVYIMPLGVNRHDLMVRTQDIAAEVVKRGWNLTTRLHILVHGDKRGV
jgi:7-carboxy-7-deazaguanine synthase